MSNYIGEIELYTEMECIKCIIDQNIVTKNHMDKYRNSQIDSIMLKNIISVENDTFINFSCINVFFKNSIIRNIGNKAFSNCRRLKNITIPKTTVHIGNYAFDKCDNLKINFEPKSLLLSFGNYCFRSCSNIKNITIPKYIQNIGEGCFYNCYNLINIKMNECNNLYV